ncbi:MAG TPA: SDR family oxidoreductase [Thermomicrobiales bacterium]|jgi:short-subunit dehydrogenase|nr:SDR family oxidoreductase [Thermomicrobiales bacterium]
MAKKMKDLVVVITGASSGIGQATALEFAEQGANVVLAARREWALRDVAMECERRGGQAIHVPTDTTDVTAVQELARRAIERFGRIDVWVNNAAVGLFSRFEDAPLSDYLRVIETDLFGYIYGARAALPLFYRQGHGVLINVGSIMSDVPAPYNSAYVIAKHGVRALGESLRQEAQLAGAKDINVCTVMPATIDTPFFQHSANYTGRAVKAMPPVYPADSVAKTIVDLVAHPQREVVVGNAGRLMAVQQSLAPGMSERMLATMIDKQHLADDPAPPTSGNLFSPMGDGARVSGGWRPTDGASKARKLATAALVGIPAALVWRQYWKETVAMSGARGNGHQAQGNGRPDAQPQPLAETEVIG